MLSERLQIDSTLNLEKAITSVRQSEAVKSQQATLRGHLQEDSSVNTIKGGSHRSQPNQKPWNSRPQNGPFKPNQKPWNRPQSQIGPFNTLNTHRWCCTKKPICTRRPETFARDVEKLLPMERCSALLETQCVISVHWIWTLVVKDTSCYQWRRSLPS